MNSHFPISKLNETLLRCVLLFSGPLRKSGVEIESFTTIVSVKLLMDDRRPATLMQMRSGALNKKKEGVSGQSLRTFLLTGLLGIFLLFLFLASPDKVISLMMFFGAYMFILGFSIISDFTAVLTDTRDNVLLLPRPVNDRTIVAARLAHILIALCRLSIPMAVPSVVLIFIRDGLLAGLSLVPLVILITLLDLFFINAVYIVILRIVKPARFQNIITWFQIVFAILIYGSYQVLPRMIANTDLSKFNLNVHPELVVLPPYWYAGAWALLNGYREGWLYAGLTLLAFATPFVGIWLVIKFLAPSFNRRLALIGPVSDSPVKTRGGTPVKLSRSRSFADILAGWTTRNAQERTGFLFTWKMMIRSREFKLKTYPSFGYIAVIVIMMLVQSTGKYSALQIAFSDPSKSVPGLIILSYFSVMILNQVLLNIKYSDKYKAGWFFRIAPLNSPGAILSGSVKAVMAQFLLPFAVIVLILMLVFTKPVSYPAVILAVLVQFALTAVYALIYLKQIPFTVPLQSQPKTNFLVGLLLTGVTGILGVIQYFISSFPWVNAGLAIFTAYLLYLLLKEIRERSYPLD